MVVRKELERAAVHDRGAVLKDRPERHAERRLLWQVPAALQMDDRTSKSHGSEDLRRPSSVKSAKAYHLVRFAQEVVGVVRVMDVHVEDAASRFGLVGEPVLARPGRELSIAGQVDAEELSVPLVVHDLLEERVL